jgi:hypothetical protein
MTPLKFAMRGILTLWQGQPHKNNACGLQGVLRAERSGRRITGHRGNLVAV